MSVQQVADVDMSVREEEGGQERREEEEGELDVLAAIEAMSRDRMQALGQLAPGVLSSEASASESDVEMEGADDNDDGVTSAASAMAFDPFAAGGASEEVRVLPKAGKAGRDAGVRLGGVQRANKRKAQEALLRDAETIQAAVSGVLSPVREEAVSSSESSPVQPVREKSVVLQSAPMEGVDFVPRLSAKKRRIENGGLFSDSSDDEGELEVATDAVLAESDDAAADKDSGDDYNPDEEDPVDDDDEELQLLQMYQLERTKKKANKKAPESQARKRKTMKELLQLQSDTQRLLRETNLQMGKHTRHIEPEQVASNISSLMDRLRQRQDTISAPRRDFESDRLLQIESLTPQELAAVGAEHSEDEDADSEDSDEASGSDSEGDEDDDSDSDEEDGVVVLAADASGSALQLNVMAKLAAMRKRKEEEKRQQAKQRQLEEQKRQQEEQKRQQEEQKRQQEEAKRKAEAKRKQAPPLPPNQPTLTFADTQVDDYEDAEDASDPTTTPPSDDDDDEDMGADPEQERIFQALITDDAKQGAADKKLSKWIDREAQESDDEEGAGVLKDVSGNVIAQPKKQAGGDDEEEEARQLTPEEIAELRKMIDTRRGVETSEGQQLRDEQFRTEQEEMDKAAEQQLQDRFLHTNEEERAISSIWLENERRVDAHYEMLESAMSARDRHTVHPELGPDALNSSKTRKMLWKQHMLNMERRAMFTEIERSSMLDAPAEQDASDIMSPAELRKKKRLLDARARKRKLERSLSALDAKEAQISRSGPSRSSHRILSNRSRSLLRRGSNDAPSPKVSDVPLLRRSRSRMARTNSSTGLSTLSGLSRPSLSRRASSGSGTSSSGELDFGRFNAMISAPSSGAQTSTASPTSGKGSSTDVAAAAAAAAAAAGVPLPKTFSGTQKPTLARSNSSRSRGGFVFSRDCKTVSRDSNPPTTSPPPASSSSTTSRKKRRASTALKRPVLKRSKSSLSTLLNRSKSRIKSTRSRGGSAV